MKKFNSYFDKNLILSYLSLFTSFGTIFCCALPALLVSIGMGAAFAGLVGAFPQIVWLSENKLLVFILSAVMISISAFILYLNRNAPCPIDPTKAKACKFGRKWALRLISLSIFFWIIGFSFAFIIPLFMN